MQEFFDKAAEAFSQGVDAASGLFDKGKDFLSDLPNNAVGVGKYALAKAKIADQNIERDILMKRLGKAAYEYLKADDTFVGQNAELFDSIEACEQRIQQLEDELAEMEAAADAQQPIDIDPVEPEQAADGTTPEPEKVVAQTIDPDTEGNAE